MPRSSREFICSPVAETRHRGRQRVCALSPDVGGWTAFHLSAAKQEVRAVLGFGKWSEMSQQVCVWHRPPGGSPLCQCFMTLSESKRRQSKASLICLQQWLRAAFKNSSCWFNAKFWAHGDEIGFHCNPEQYLIISTERSAAHLTGEMLDYLYTHPDGPDCVWLNIHSCGKAEQTVGNFSLNPKT